MTMEAFCVNLWTVLSNFIGTKEEVLLQRRNFELHGKLQSFDSGQSREIYSGSKAEGLDLEGSDYDIMFVRCDLPVSMLTQLGNDETNIVMETDHIKPGFVRLRCKDAIRNNGELISSLIQTNDGLFLSSLFFRDNAVDELKRQYPGAFAHGPCASLVQVSFEPKVVEFDLMYCLPCSTWPASEWRHRTRNNGWPSCRLIEDIIQEGCLLVPIGNPHSDISYMQWRISFSLAEKRLVHSFNHTQLLCYGLLKLFLKHAINSNIEVKDLLCSYFLKTSLFYCIEEENISWCKENIFDCFWMCFRRLLKWVQQGYCPNYFIQENNMMEGKICGPKQRILLRYLTKLHAEGHGCLGRIPCLSGIVLGCQQGVSTVIELRKIELLCDMQLSIIKIVSGFIGNSKNENFKTLEMLTKMIPEATTNIDKTILQVWCINLTNVLIQQLYKETLGTNSNKTRYKMLKGLKRFIKLNCMNLDECTRMLMLATLCYLNGEYMDVVSIVEELLKNYGRLMIMIRNCETYMDVICGKGYTLQQKMEFGVFSYSINLICDCGYYPREIESEISQWGTSDSTSVPSVLYSNVLLFLSYYHLKLTQNMNFALNELSLAAHCHPYPNSDRSIAISLFHKCLQIIEPQRDNVS